MSFDNTDYFLAYCALLYLSDPEKALRISILAQLYSKVLSFLSFENVLQPCHFHKVFLMEFLYFFNATGTVIKIEIHNPLTK